jgi:hypothetical protein
MANSIPRVIASPDLDDGPESEAMSPIFIVSCANAGVLRAVSAARAVAAKARRLNLERTFEVMSFPFDDFGMEMAAGCRRFVGGTSNPA